MNGLLKAMRIRQPKPDLLDMPRQHHRARDVFGDGGRRMTSRATTNGRRRLQEQYDVKRITSFTPAEVDDFRQIFEFYDVDNSKTMDTRDLAMALRSLGFNPTDKEIDVISSLMDVDGDTSLDFSEFCMIIEHLKDVKGEFGDLREAFKCIDHNDDGYVTTDDLIQMMMTKGHEMSLKEAHEMTRFADKDRSGLINYDDFIEALQQRQNERMRDLEMRVSSTSSSSGSSYPDEGINGGRGNEENKKRSNQSRKAEFIDTVIKAIGGPILLTSAIIIKSSQNQSSPKSKRTRWPSVNRVLSLKK